MSELALYILSLALLLSPGKMYHSLELRPDCGTDPAAPACEMKRVCDDKKSAMCAPPRWESCFYGYLETFSAKKDKKAKEPICHPWNSSPGAWVQIESREAAGERYLDIADAIAYSANELGSEWPEGERDFARAMLTTSYWSTGLREDIQRGRTRGPGGEVCLMDLKVATLRQFGSRELASLTDEAMISNVVGLGLDQLRNCFYAGGQALLRARKAAGWLCKSNSTWGQPMLQSTFAVYHTGSACTSVYVRIVNKWKWCPECKRYGTMMKFRARERTEFPDWFNLI